MSGMILQLDEFDEGESLRAVHLEATSDEAARLLADSGYRITGPLAAEFDVNLVGTTVRIRGALGVEVAYECGRCLESQSLTLALDTEFVLLEKQDWIAKYESSEELELDDDDMDVSFYVGKKIDLAPLLREAILLDLPILPRCPDEGRAKCDEAYRNNVGDTALQQLDEAALDPRWAALNAIKLKE